MQIIYIAQIYDASGGTTTQIFESTNVTKVMRYLTSALIAVRRATPVDVATALRAGHTIQVIPEEYPGLEEPSRKRRGKRSAASLV